MRAAAGAANMLKNNKPPSSEIEIILFNNHINNHKIKGGINVHTVGARAYNKLYKNVFMNLL